VVVFGGGEILQSDDVESGGLSVYIISRPSALVCCVSGCEGYEGIRWLVLPWRARLVIRHIAVCESKRRWFSR
jgi:hypothetical protein